MADSKYLPLAERAKAIDEIAYGLGDAVELACGNSWLKECEKFVNQTQPLAEAHLGKILKASHTTHGKVIVAGYIEICNWDCVKEDDNGDYHLDVNALSQSQFETLKRVNSTLVDFLKNGAN